jgi:hypothetical protein
MAKMLEGMRCRLPRRERMRERELERNRRLMPFLWSRSRPEASDRWADRARVLQDPDRRQLEKRLREAAEQANARARVRRVRSLGPAPVLAYPDGVMEENGIQPGMRVPHRSYTSVVGVAWITLAGVKYVRVWGERCYSPDGPSHCHLFLPDPSDRDGMRCCWALVFPGRYLRLRAHRVERLRRFLERLGPPGEDDRMNLNLWTARARGYVPALGLILSDDLARTRVVQVVVRDPSTGLRHHISVPPRFGNPQAKTFQRLGNARARIHAAVAWTFGMKPEEYEPTLEA